MGRSNRNARDNEDGDWMQDAVKPSHRGLLREKLHIHEGKNIPMSKLEKASHSKSPSLRKEAVLAETFKRYHK